MADRIIEATPLLLALRQLRSIERDAKGSVVTLTCFEAGALLDALDLLRRVREGVANDPSGGGPSVSSEDWTLINEAADAVEDSR